MGHKLVVGLLALVACGGGADGASSGLATVEIGSSVSGYMPLTDGDPILLYRGPQGGYHVYLGLRASGVAPGSPGEATRLCEGTVGTSPCVEFDVIDVDSGTTLDAYVGLRVALTESPDAPGSYELVPPRLVQLGIASLDELDGHRLRIIARVDDRAGVHVEDSVEAICAAVR